MRIKLGPCVVELEQDDLATVVAIFGLAVIGVTACVHSVDQQSVPVITAVAGALAGFVARGMLPRHPASTPPSS